MLLVKSWSFDGHPSVRRVVPFDLSLKSPRLLFACLSNILSEDIVSDILANNKRPGLFFSSSSNNQPNSKQNTEAVLDGESLSSAWSCWWEGNKKEIYTLFDFMPRP